MTQTLGKYQQSNNARSSPQGLAMHRDSRVIAKIQPKIRIIHIFAPEIIHTDVAHFSETVQRLTGKPSSTTASASAPSIKKSINVNASPTPRATNKLPIKDDDHLHQQQHHHHDSYGHQHGFDHGGFLDALQGSYNLMQEIGELSFVSMEAGGHHQQPPLHLNGFGEAHHSFSYRG